MKTKLLHITKYTLGIIFALFICLRCSKPEPESPFATVEFTHSIKSQTDPYTIVFTASTTGSYDLLEWVFPNGNTIENSPSVEYYFGKKGSHKVTINLWKSGKKVTSSKTIEILIDDPNLTSKLLWADEFDGNTLKSDIWTLEQGYIANNELQNYQSTGNHSLSGGFLTIQAKKVNDNNVFGSYTSARMITGGKKHFTYGRIEIRAKLPKGRGIWPAIWMLGANLLTGTNWPQCGEIDIMENVGYNPGYIKGSIHCGQYFGGSSQNGDHPYYQGVEDDFHIYGINWTPEKIEFYLDDSTRPYFTYSPNVKTSQNWPFDKAHFLILNVAVGGDWGGLMGVDNTIFPQSMVVDYVRVYNNGFNK